MKSLVPGGTRGVHAETVKAKLKNAVLFYFELEFKKGHHGGGDHHFCAFPLDKDTVIAAMGWQGIYDFSDWFRENEQGRYTTANFLKHMRAIEDGSSTAVVDLCAYLGVSRKGTGIVTAVLGEVSGFRPSFKSSFYFDLPKR